MTKPFSLEELVARLRGLLRRSGQPPTPTAETLIVGDLRVDTASREVTRGDTAVSLSSTEFELLRFLMRNPRRAEPHRDPGPGVELRLRGAHQHRGSLHLVLEEKIDSGREPMIHTVRGVGYMLRPAE